MLPGPDVQILDAAPPPTQLTDTGTGFIVGFSDRGTTTANIPAGDVTTSLGDFTTRFGARQSYNGPEYDAVEAFFAEGGSRLYFSRKVGPAAVKAQANVPVASSKFTAIAKGPGASYNTLSVAVTSGVITIRDAGTIVEVSPAFATIADAQSWAQSSSDYLSDLTPLTSGALADSAAVSLAGGADDRTNTTDVQIQAALDRFGKDLGPGQVAMPGDGRLQAYTMLATHARDRNRFAYGDAPDTPTVATVTSVAASVRALGRELARHIQVLDPWLFAPGTATGTQRTVAPSGVQMGMAARVDSAGNPNRAVAGSPGGVSRFATAPKYTRTDAERSSLADAGVTVYRLLNGVVQAYDDVVPVDPVVDPEWVGAAGNRLVMRIVQDALAIAGVHMFGSVAGSVDFAKFNGDLVGMLAGWFTAGALYGDTPQDAFRVETGPSVNTPDTIASRQLKAALALKIAPNTRQVVVLITNTPLQSAL